LRAQQHRGDGREPPGATVEREQVGQNDVRKAVGVGRHEGVAEQVTAAVDAPARVRRRAGAHDLHLPAEEPALEMVKDDLLAGTDRQHEVRETLPRVDVHLLHVAGLAFRPLGIIGFGRHSV